VTNQLAIPTLENTLTIADAFVESGFFKDARSQSQAIVKILAGQELGFGPMASMTGIHIIQGKVTLSANIMAAALKRTGRYNYRVTTMTAELCVIDFYEGSENVGTSSFSIADAEVAGLLKNATWTQYPRNMLFARAMSNGVRWYTPDLYGAPLYTPDELGESVDGETGEIITVQATIVNEPEPEANGDKTAKLAKWIREQAILNPNASITTGQAGALVNILEGYFSDADDAKAQRLHLLSVIFDREVVSSNDLSDAEKWAVWTKWLLVESNPYTTEDGKEILNYQPQFSQAGASVFALMELHSDD